MVVVMLIAIPSLGGAQHHAHDSASHRASIVVSGAMTPEVVRATPTAGARSLTEGYLAHPVVMLHAASAGGTFAVHAMANFEGLTLRRGELATGVWGEGYVDRRHPHAYVHEVIVSAMKATPAVAFSLSAGRGFAPFGSDDPLVRPMVRYPVNHHHAQILERLVAIGAVRARAVTLEAGMFNGDEPLGPGSPPRVARFADSWSSRLTWRPTIARNAVELSASFASVRSPEDPTAVTGLDQRKWHLSARSERDTPVGVAYALVEWARTTDYSGARRAFEYGSVLGEGSLCHRLGAVALRAERTDRHEEERLFDLFRTPVPHGETSIIGVTRWTTVGVQLRTRPGRWGVLRATPFAEGTFLRPEPRFPTSLFRPREFYGRTRLWQFAGGARARLGSVHHRMGRYGVAQSPASHAHTPCQ